MTQKQVKSQIVEVNCDLCQKPMELTLVEEATLDSIKEMRTLHTHCAGGMNEDGTLKPIGEWLDEIKRFRENPPNGLEI